MQQLRNYCLDPRLKTKIMGENFRLTFRAAVTSRTAARAGREDPNLVLVIPMN